MGRGDLYSRINVLSHPYMGLTCKIITENNNIEHSLSNPISAVAIQAKSVSA